MSNRSADRRLCETRLTRERPLMLTQIYEVSTPDEARAISVISVDHIGILVGNGDPRELPVEAAAKVAAGIVPPSKFSALFLTADISLIEQWAQRLKPAIVHLGAALELLSLEDAAMLRAKLPACSSCGVSPSSARSASTS